MSVREMNGSQLKEPLPVVHYEAEQNEQRIQQGSLHSMPREPELSAYLNQYDALVKPLIGRLMDPRCANQPVTWNLTGEEIASLLGQLRGFIPKIATLPHERRADYPFQVVVGGKALNVKLGAIPKYLESLYQSMGSGQEFQYLCHERNPQIGTGWVEVSETPWEAKNGSNRTTFGSKLWAYAEEIFKMFQKANNIERLTPDQFSQWIIAKKAKGPTETTESNFVSGTVSSFLKEDVWNMKQLKKQIEKDCERMPIYLNGERSSFEHMCLTLKLDSSLFKREEVLNTMIPQKQVRALYFMSLLQQGSAFACWEKILHLNNNQAGLTLKQGDAPIQVHGQYEDETWDFSIIQQLELFHPQKNSSHPIEIKLYASENQPTRISWRFC
jgi:hypothetical protein